MKHIRKSLANEPESLRHEKSTPGASFDDCSKKNIQQALLKEQEYLCAYCMGRISADPDAHGRPNMSIEHYYPRQLCIEEGRPELALDFMNMLGVCTGGAKPNLHCDKTPGPKGKAAGKVTLRKLDPRRPEVEQLLTYTTGGEIVSVNGDSDVEHDLNEVLNLNHDKLKERRKQEIDFIRNRIVSAKPTGD